MAAAVNRTRPTTCTPARRTTRREGLEDQGTGRWGGFLFTAGGVSRRGLEDRGKAELGYDGSASGDLGLGG